MKRMVWLMYQNRRAARLYLRTSLLSLYLISPPMESPKLNPVFVAQRCCLRCGRADNIGAEHVDQCEDCEAMGFNID